MWCRLRQRLQLLIKPICDSLILDKLTAASIQIEATSCWFLMKHELQINRVFLISGCCWAANREKMEMTPIAEEQGDTSQGNRLLHLGNKSGRGVLKFKNDGWGWCENSHDSLRPFLCRAFASFFFGVFHSPHPPWWKDGEFLETCIKNPSQSKEMDQRRNHDSWAHFISILTLYSTSV